MNQDVIDLYDRVPPKAPVIVTSDVSQPMAETANRKAIPIDGGVPDGSVLLGPASEQANLIFRASGASRCSASDFYQPGK